MRTFGACQSLVTTTGLITGGHQYKQKLLFVDIIIVIVTPSGYSSVEMALTSITPIISIVKGLYFQILFAPNFSHSPKQELRFLLMFSLFQVDNTRNKVYYYYFIIIVITIFDRKVANERLMQPLQPCIVSEYHFDGQLEKSIV